MRGKGSVPPPVPQIETEVSEEMEVFFTLLTLQVAGMENSWTFMDSSGEHRRNKMVSRSDMVRLMLNHPASPQGIKDVQRGYKELGIGNERDFIIPMVEAYFVWREKKQQGIK